MNKTDVLIIGAGPAGLFSVFQAGMLGMKCSVVDTLPSAGGQCIELYPEKPIFDVAGFPNILAKDLISNLQLQAKPFNADYHFNNQVISVEKVEDGFRSITDKGLIFESKIVIVASGNGSFVPNKPLVKNIEEYENTSVFYSISNPEVFRNKNILIAGGGDSAVDWAIMLQSIARKIYLVHRRDKFRCNQDNFNKIKELEKSGNLEILVPYQLLEIQGKEQKITNIVLQNFTTNQNLDLEVDCFLAFFGLKMDLGPIKEWGLEIENNRLKVDPCFYQTSTPGIYAIGDISTHEGKLKLIVNGFAESASALHHAYGKVFNGKQLHFEYSTNKGIPNS
jgi:thioredoxin reductase (NADPH)